jgi:hypothetical protein
MAKIYSYFCDKLNTVIMSIDQKEFDYAIEKIDDGFIFEAFGYEFLAAVLGYDFIPTGGTVYILKIEGLTDFTCPI